MLLSVAKEIHYLSRLTGVDCPQFRHTLISAKVNATLATARIWAYTVPNNSTWLMCFFFLRSLPPVNAASLTVGDWRSDDFDANGLSKAYITVNGAPLNTQNLSTFGLFNKPLLLAFAGNAFIEVVVSRNALSVAPNEVIHSCAHGYLAPTELYSELSWNQSSIEGTYTGV